MNAIFLLQPKENVVYLFEDNTVRRALQRMREAGYTALPVITRDGRYMGSINEGDILRHILASGGTEEAWSEAAVSAVLPAQDRTPPARVDVPMEELLACSLNQNFVPVVDDRGTFIGIITRQSILGYFTEQLHRQGS